MKDTREVVKAPVNHGDKRQGRRFSTAPFRERRNSCLEGIQDLEGSSKNKTLI